MLTLALLFVQASGPLDVYGTWVIPPDEEGGPSRGVVEVAKVDGAPVGTIAEVGEAYADDPEAGDALGMRILWGFEADGDGDGWEDGKILDPEKGKTYRSKIRREGEALSVKGCVAFFCREQVWQPADTDGEALNAGPSGSIRAER